MLRNTSDWFFPRIFDDSKQKYLTTESLFRDQIHVDLTIVKVVKIKISKQQF